MLHAVERVHRIGVAGFAAGGNTAPLVDRHIHHHGAGLHLLHQRLLHQGGGPATGGEHGTNE